MTTGQDQTSATAVRRSITVDAPVEQAFQVFTNGFGTWWPMDYPPVTRILRPC